MDAGLKDPRIREHGLVNWIGLRTLYVKEVRRFVKVSVQTIFAPVLQTLLFMAVLTIAWGGVRGDVLGVPFSQFLAPGLIMMSILAASFQNASSSLIVAKMQGISVDFLMPPLSAFELTAAFVGGAATRGVVVGLVSIPAVLPFAQITPTHFWAILYFAVAASVMLGAAGAFAGIWADKFDHLAAVTSFVITPLTFLSGTFYSIAALPAPLAEAARWNPFFHLIDGFRYGFIGAADGSLAIGVAMTLIVDAALVVVVYAVFRSGWRMKA